MKIVAIFSLSLNVVLLILIISFLPQDEYQLSTFDEKEKISYNNPFGKKEIEKINALIDYGSVLVVDGDGDILLDYYGNERLIPASTLKVATSLVALRYLGKDYRFITEFKLDKQRNLYIKGLGDPSLTSNEIRLIIKQLKEKGLKQINSIYIDGSYFEDTIMVPGNEDTYKSYDAKNTALAANYNTIAFKRKGKKVISGEDETPYFPFAGTLLKKAEKEIKKLKRLNSFRIAIKEGEDSLLYFGHLFKELCKEFSIKTKGKIVIRKSPVYLPIFHLYHSSKTLSEIVKDLLEFSNNFTANQILLILSTRLGEPATLENGVKVVSDFLKRKVLLKDIRLSEGSGLSYANKVTANEMLRVLGYFKPYKKLLKEVEMNVFAKSGGLKTVMSYVGFIDTERYGEVRFAIILNQSSNNKSHILKLLTETLK